ncbi:MAG TPA: methylenetetrahydrofolate reductase C-terminal domain-containing protein [Bacteroidales bacterium]|nr:methylenetetrahydrofolate reductase C-terminal domain-containing protein [Bacteroidales bacterium]
MALFTPLRRWQPAFRPFGRASMSDRMLAFTERFVKGPFFGCRMCGNCLLQETAFICHMECPKGIRNGPCGGVNNGYCYVDPQRKCVWSLIFERSRKMHREQKLLEVLPPVDWDRAGTETWGEVVRKVREAGLRKIFLPVRGKVVRDKLEELVFKPIRQPEWWKGDSEYHPPAVTEPQSFLETQLRTGKFIITCEVMPPLSASSDRLAEKITLLKPYASAINFTDGSSAIPRMSSIACCSVASSLGVDPVLQVSARDNTRSGLQSLAVGANTLGARNILCLSGDSPRVGPQPRGNLNIIDVDSVQMLWILRRMRDEGIYLDGREMKHPPKFFLGAAASPFAQDPSLQVIRDRKKINAGAQFFQTNLVFDPDSLDGWLENLEKQQLLDKVFILVGVSPLKTLNMAKYLNDRIPGITIPPNIMKRMERAGVNAAEEGIEISVEIIRKLRNKRGISGIHIMPLGWEASIPQIIKASF